MDADHITSAVIHALRDAPVWIFPKTHGLSYDDYKDVQRQFVGEVVAFTLSAHDQHTSPRMAPASQLAGGNEWEDI
jgi:hypothetical protein